MIVDCYTHFWEAADQVGMAGEPSNHHSLFGRTIELDEQATSRRHAAAAEPADRVIVLGFKSHYLGAEIPNDLVSKHVRNYPERMVGFAGIDPSTPKEAIEELERCHSQLGLMGAAVSPAAQDFHPSNSQAMLVYARACELGMPVIFDTGIETTAATKLEYAQPILLDEIARELPKLKIVIAHMGQPWIGETVVLLAKHANVYADISLLLHQPRQAYQALLQAHEYGVISKLLFGSGFPYQSVSECIEAIFGINHLVHGTNMPTIPREQLRSIVERDALPLLGIGNPQPASTNTDDPEDF